MKRAALAAALLLAAPAFAEGRVRCGAVETLEITSLTRTKATAFLRVRLPEAPAGAKSSFDGKVEVANTRIPIGMPITAMAQRREDSIETVLLVDLDLAKIPADLLGGLHPAALDVTLEGTLRSSSQATPVCAAGVLKVGTSDIRASGPVGQDFAKFGGARLGAMSLSETQGQASVVLFNPLSFPLDVKDLVYEIRSGGRRIAAGERHGLRLHPARENSVDLPLTAANADLVGLLAEAMASGRVEGTLVATISVKVGKDQIMTVPLNLPGTIQVGR
jgi:LEA14-like dessication related protein